MLFGGGEGAGNRRGPYGWPHGCPSGFLVVVVGLVVAFLAVLVAPWEREERVPLVVSLGERGVVDSSMTTYM